MREKKKYNHNIPDEVIQAFASCALPLIRQFYATEEGRRAYEEWEKEQKECG